MMLQSCQNCWFNGLQYGSVGLSYGYCARHKVVLNNADETTCGQHIRKDLGFERAQEVSRVHSKHFDNRIIVRVLGGEHLEHFSIKKHHIRSERSNFCTLPG